MSNPNHETVPGVSKSKQEVLNFFSSSSLHASTSYSTRGWPASRHPAFECPLRMSFGRRLPEGFGGLHSSESKEETSHVRGQAVPASFALQKANADSTWDLRTNRKPNYLRTGRSLRSPWYFLCPLLVHLNNLLPHEALQWWSPAPNTPVENRAIGNHQRVPKTLMSEKRIWPPGFKCRTSDRRAW